MADVAQYLDCGCAMLKGGGRSWCPTCLDGPRPTEPAPSDDTAILDAILAVSALSPTEDGEALWLYVGGKGNERQHGALEVATATGEDNDEPFTTADVPFLTESQRAQLNGVAGADIGPWKWATDPSVLRAAVRAALRGGEPTPTGSDQG